MEVESEFVREALPPSAKLLGLNSTAMEEYVQFVANRLLLELGYEPLRWSPSRRLPRNPFPFMEMISLQGKTNFFEKRVGEYQKANVLAAPELEGEFTLDADF